MRKKWTLTEIFTSLFKKSKNMFSFQGPTSVMAQIFEKGKVLKTTCMLLFVMLITVVTPSAAAANGDDWNNWNYWNNYSISIGAISGTPQVGAVLTAGNLQPSSATANYQWQEATTVYGNYTPIAGATGTTYTPVAADVSKFIKVVATGTGSYYGSATSSPTAAVATAPITAIGAITGTPQVGSLLTAGALTPTGATATYQWEICSTSDGTYTDISGATGNTYTPVAGDETKFIKVVAAGTGGYSGTVTSAIFPATTIPIDIEKFDQTNVAGDNGTTLLWSRGDASTTGGVLRVAPNINDKAGAVVRRSQIQLKGGFSTYFVMNLNNGTQTPADGLVFVIQSNPTPLLGCNGAGMGFGGGPPGDLTHLGVPNSLGVEFDLYPNDGPDPKSTNNYYYDPAKYHVAICKNGDNTLAPANNNAVDDGTGKAEPTGSTLTLGDGSPIPYNPNGNLTLYGQPVNVWIDYDGTTLTATYGPSSTRNSSKNRILSENVGSYLNNRNVFVGFSAGTGSLNANIDVDKWYFSDTYVSNGLDPDPNAYTQGANSVEIALNPGSTNPTSANFVVKDIDNNVMTNQNVDVYLDGSSTPITTINTGADGNQANYSIGSLSPGSHTITGVAANGGASNTVTFNVTAPLTAIGAISGTAQVGSVLTAGALTPAEGTASYQWQIATSANGVYSNISGATGTTYTPVAGDVTKFIEVVATGTGNYTGTVTSAPTTVVEAKNGTAQASLKVSPGAATIPLGSTQQFQALFIDSNGTTAPAEDAFDYALFSGSQTSDLSISGNNHTVTGNAHSNNDVKLSGTTNVITGTCEAVTTVKISGNNNTVGSAVQNAAIIGMPDFSSQIQALAAAAGQTYDGNVTYSGNKKVSVTSPIYINGDLNISGCMFSGMGTIVATGDIHISGNSSYTNGNDSVCLYSKNGDIKITGNSQTVNGMLYAPNGTISISGQNQTINGRVIGNEIKLSGGNIQINSTSNDLNSLPQLNWSSSNPNVASISSTGVATGNNLGTCTITATYILNNVTYQASAQLTVFSQTAISPTTATFDKNTRNTSAGHYADIPVTMTLNGNSLTSIMNGSKVLNAGSDYSVSEGIVTLSKTYLSTLPTSETPTNLTFTFSSGNTQVLAVKVIDSTPTISPATATFDKNTWNTSAGHYADIPVTMTLNGNSLTSIMNGSKVLNAGSDYSVSEGIVTLSKTYLSTLPTSETPTNLTFTFSSGNTQVLAVTVVDSTPTIDPTMATFDKNTWNTSAGHYADIPVTMTLNGNSLTSITNGSTTLNFGSDYSVSGSNVTLSKTYLSTLPTSDTPTNLTFTFSSGNTPVLGIMVSDSSTPTISPTTATFDKNTSNTNTGHYADIPVTMTLNGSSLTSIANGKTLLNEGSDYTKSDITNGIQTLTLSKTYLSTLPTSETPTNLIFTFSGGYTQVLGITVSNSKLISNLSITTRAGSHRISILPNVPIQAIVGFDLSRQTANLAMDFIKSNVTVNLSDSYCYCGHTKIYFSSSVDPNDSKKFILLPSDPATLFPDGTYTFNALVTDVGTSLILDSTVTAQDTIGYSDSDEAASDTSSLKINVGTAPPLH